MREPMGVDRQVEEVMRSRVSNLSSDGRIEGFHQVDTNIITGGGLAWLLQHGVELGMVDGVSPTSTSACPLQTKGEKGTQCPAQLGCTIHGANQRVVPI